MTRPHPITARPVAVRADSIAELPDPDLVASIVDAAVEAQPTRTRDLLHANPDAHVEVFVTDHAASVWLDTHLVARVPPTEGTDR